MSEQKAYLLLANGQVFEGKSFGVTGTTIGEVVFATGMTGYQEKNMRLITKVHHHNLMLWIFHSITLDFFCRYSFYCIFDFISLNLRQKLLFLGIDILCCNGAVLLAINPDGVMLTNGPGNPEENTEVIETLKKLIAAKMPMFGICLGHQLTALANGGIYTV